MKLGLPINHLQVAFRSLSAVSLESLHVKAELHHEMYNQPTPSPEEVSAWEPLTWFHNLRELTVAVECPRWCVDDAAWDRYARAWPRLHLLKITQTGPAYDDRFYATHKSLISIARWCPELRELVLPITNVSRPADWDREQRTLPIATHLDRLSLTCLEAAELVFLAECVTALFPSLWAAEFPAGIVSVRPGRSKSRVRTVRAEDVARISADFARKRRGSS